MDINICEPCKSSQLWWQCEHWPYVCVQWRAKHRFLRIIGIMYALHLINECWMLCCTLHAYANLQSIIFLGPVSKEFLLLFFIIIVQMTNMWYPKQTTWIREITQLEIKHIKAIATALFALNENIPCIAFCTYFSHNNNRSSY